MRPLVTLGALAAVGGLAVVVRPSLAGTVSPTYLLVAGLGVFAVLTGVGAARARLESERLRADLPAVEERRTVPAPGAAFDDLLARLSRADGRTAAELRATVRERLETTAVNVLVHEGHSRERAHAMLETGEWTDDPMAAAFFAEGTTGSLADSVWGAIKGETAFQRHARRVAVALHERLEGGK
ncbi:DUF7269 family protein [Natronomonas sp. EA1]|uniref:DUF7269 family protein n=1 Tax=Natronomonas sp. EA1 TaxID=3421655 RepID=UPI003EB6CF1D